MTYPTTALDMARDAKAYRDEAGRPDPTADAYLTLLEAGLVKADSAERYVGPSGPKITGVKRHGASGAGIATEYTHERPGAGGNGMGHGRVSRPTPKMINYIHVLLRQVPADVAAKARPWFEQHEATMTFDQARDTINRLKAHRDGAAQTPQAPVDTPAPVADRPTPSRSAWALWDELAAPLAAMGGQHGARFAVPSATGNNDLDFWVVNTWTGRNGRTMHGLKRYIGGQGPVIVRMTPEAKVAVAQAIHAAGPMEALKLFGRELGVCGDCGRSLTDEVSRSEGRGPICRNK
jgi:Family of unknown function (DUF6011)